MATHTIDQWMTAISRAERAGDAEAATNLRHSAQADLTGTGTLTERIGAGVQDVVNAGKRWAGRLGDADQAEGERIAKMADPGGWGRMAGQVGASAPLMLIPGVNTGIGSAIAGGAMGGFMSPDDPLKGAAIGAGGAGLVTGGMRVLPRVGGAIADQVAQRTPLMPGRKQAIAERAFADSIPAAERDAVRQSLAGYQEVIPGFEQTTGSVARSPRMLEVERKLSQGGSQFGEPLKRRAGEQAAAVTQAWENEFGRRSGQLQSDIASNAREAFVDSAKPVRFSAAPDEFPGVAAAFDAELANASGPHAATLNAVRDQFDEALAHAQRNGMVEPLHNWRRSAINDALARMHTEGATQGQKIARDSLDNVKRAFDQEMERQLGGQRWSNYMSGYRSRSTDVSHAQAGEDMLGRLNARPEMAGAPGVRDPSGLGTNLRQQFAEGSPTSRYGTPVYSPSGETVLRNTMNEMSNANQMFAKNVAPVNSATAANQQPAMRILTQAEKAQRALDNNGLTIGHGFGGGIGAGVGALTAGPWGAAVGGLVGAGVRSVVAPARARAMEDIAQRVVQLYADPRQALAALDRLALPPTEMQMLAQRVMELAGPRAGLAGGVGANAYRQQMEGQRAP